jgi:hypothetical protein
MDVRECCVRDQEVLSRGQRVEGRGQRGVYVLMMYTTTEARVMTDCTMSKDMPTVPITYIT